MGIVHHANYLVWFEIGRTKYMESIGFKYAEVEEDGLLLPVLNVNVSYKKPVKYGDKVSINTALNKYNGVKTHFYYEVVSSNGDVHVTGETEHVFVQKHSFKPTIVRKVYPEWDERLKQIIGER